MANITKEDLEYTIRKRLDEEGIEYEATTTNGKRLLMPKGLEPDEPCAVLNIDGLWSACYSGKTTPEEVADYSVWCLRQKEIPAPKIPKYARDIKELLTITLWPLKKAIEAKVLYKPFLDLAIVPRAVLAESEKGIMSYVIPENMAEQYGVTAGELIQAALENSPKKSPVQIMPIDDILKKMLGGLGNLFPVPKSPIPLMVVTVKNFQYGAAAILYPGVLEKIREAMGGKDFYILPSSVHEVIAAPILAGGAKEMREMVAEINGNSHIVEPEEVLCDTVYICKGNTLEIAE